MHCFEGIWIPLVTPFRDGAVDTAALARLAGHLARQGIAGLVVAGTTGEPATLSREEQEQVLVTVLDAVAGRCPVVMGLAGADTAAVAREAAHFSHHALAGVLVTAPYYVRPSQRGLQRHFEAVAGATPLPVLIYNIPYRTGVTLELVTLQALARNPQFAAIKECGADANRLSALIEETPLAVLSGDDDMMFVNACLGGAGAITAAAHLRTADFVAMVEHVRRGELAAARAIHQSLRPLLRALFSEPNPGPLKAALALQGWVREELRLPMTPAGAACRETLRSLLVD